MDSQIPSSRPGTLSWIADGIANANLGSRGRESCRENRMVLREVLETVDADNRGRNDASIERVVA